MPTMNSRSCGVNPRAPSAPRGWQPARSHVRERPRTSLRTSGRAWQAEHVDWPSRSACERHVLVAVLRKRASSTGSSFSPHLIRLARTRRRDELEDLAEVEALFLVNMRRTHESLSRRDFTAAPCVGILVELLFLVASLAQERQGRARHHASSYCFLSGRGRTLAVRVDAHRVEPRIAWYSSMASSKRSLSS